LQYQWLRDNSPMLQATNPFLTISNAQTTDAGGYSTVVSGGGIQVTSAVATLAVMTIGQALNCPELEFSSWFTYSTPGGWQASGISNAWKYQTNITHDGMAGIQSLTLSAPALSVNPYSFLQTRLRGPGRLVFYGQGGATVTTSNGAMATWNGASLQPYEIEIADGWQTVTWQAYCVPGTIIVLDSFRFEPATPVFTANGARFSSGGGFQCPLQMNSTNVPFRIEWSADLKNWQPLIEITNYQDGLLLEDNAGATNACRFYRAVK